MFSCSEIWKSLECSFSEKYVNSRTCATVNILERWMWIFSVFFFFFLGCEKHVCFIMLLYYRVDFFTLFFFIKLSFRQENFEGNKGRLRKYRFFKECESLQQIHHFVSLIHKIKLQFRLEDWWTKVLLNNLIPKLSVN